MSTRYPLADLGTEIKVGLLPQDNRYLVFSNGQIFSTKAQRFIRARVNDRGYPYVTIKVRGQSLSVRVHRAVAETFLGPTPAGLECAHLDGDKMNSSLSNLRYVTKKENADHKVEHGTLIEGERHHAAKVTPAVVDFIKTNYKRTGQNSSNARELGERFGISRTQVCNIVRGSNWRQRVRARALLAKGGE